MRPLNRAQLVPVWRPRLVTPDAEGQGTEWRRLGLKPPSPQDPGPETQGRARVPATPHGPLRGPPGPAGDTGAAGQAPGEAWRLLPQGRGLAGTPRDLAAPALSRKDAVAGQPAFQKTL